MTNIDNIIIMKLNSMFRQKKRFPRIPIPNERTHCVFEEQVRAHMFSSFAVLKTEHENSSLERIICVRCDVTRIMRVNELLIFKMAINLS